MMNQTEVQDTRLTSSIEAIRIGDQTKARSLLELAVGDDPDDDRAWQWLAVVAETAEDQQRCLYRALSINPNNEAVRTALRQLSDQEQALVPAGPVDPVPVPTVFQPIVYYDRTPMHRLSSYALATFLSCVTALGCSDCGQPAVPAMTLPTSPISRDSKGPNRRARRSLVS